MKSLWRRQETETFRSPVDVIRYEMQELGNADIPMTVFNRYVQGSPNWFKEDYKIQIIRLEEYLSEIDRDELFEASTGEYIALAQAILDIVQGATACPVNYVIWLAEKPIVDSIYRSFGDCLCQYPVSDIILSDLGQEGCLFGYSQKPKIQ